MPSETRVLRIGADGTIGCLYSDNLGLSYLGKLNVRRASHVEFDNAAQRWTVTLANGQALGVGFATHAEAIAAEVAHLNAKVVDGTIEEVFDAS